MVVVVVEGGRGAGEVESGQTEAGGWSGWDEEEGEDAMGLAAWGAVGSVLDQVAGPSTTQG